MSLEKIEKLLAKALDQHGTEEGRTCVRQAMGLARKLRTAPPEVSADGWEREIAWKATRSGGWFAYVDELRIHVSRHAGWWRYQLGSEINTERFESADEAKRAAMEAAGV